jgi:hypothetical protein
MNRLKVLARDFFATNVERRRGDVSRIVSARDLTFSTLNTHLHLNIRVPCYFFNTSFLWNIENVWVNNDLYPLVGLSVNASSSTKTLRKFILRHEWPILCRVIIFIALKKFHAFFHELLKNIGILILLN